MPFDTALTRKLGIKSLLTRLMNFVPICWLRASSCCTRRSAMGCLCGTGCGGKQRWRTRNCKHSRLRSLVTKVWPEYIDQCSNTAWSRWASMWILVYNVPRWPELQSGFVLKFERPKSSQTSLYGSHMKSHLEKQHFSSRPGEGWSNRQHAGT